jgi:hypothetical protein
VGIKEIVGIVERGVTGTAIVLYRKEPVSMGFPHENKGR